MAENEPGLGQGAFGGGFGNTASDTGGRMANLRSQFNVDNAGMSKLISGFSGLKDRIRDVGKAAREALADINRLSQAMQTATGAGAGSTASNPSTSTASAIASATQATTALTNKPSAGGFASQRAVGGGSGFFANMRGGGGAAFGINAAMQVGGAIIGGMDRRLDGSYGRMLQTDRLGVLMQQMYGVSQQQYYSQYRQPLQQFRLGQGGITELLSLQASTGIQARGQAGGVAGLRAAMGYSYSTQDFAQVLRTLASPQVSNRMTMTMGTGLYGLGGRQRSITEVMQGIVRSAGLTNERVLAGAMQPGSMTRARLTAMGIPEDMQDMVLQYAQENMQFNRRTQGRMGMYNPESGAQRKIMGIENNFATQREESTRLAEAREEKFYNRQKDNLATMERNTQALISLTTAIEDTLSGVVGARISTRGSIGMRILKGVAGLGLMGAGAAVGFTGAGAPIGIGLAGAGLSLTGSAFTSGDGTETRGKRNSPVGQRTKQTSGSMGNLNATFRERLERMMADNPNVSVGGGYRSSAQQRTLFLSRYTRTSEKTGVFWDGSYWKKNSGVADAAPPGLSMHEIGLAADLSGDLGWVQANAHKYGLKTFADVNNEPWHVQPAELPNSRREYEKSGAPWGTIAGAEKYDPNTIFEGNMSEGGVADALYKSGVGTVPTFSQMSLSDQISAQRALNILGGGGGSVLQTLDGTPGPNKGKGGKGTKASTSTGGSVRTGTSMNPKEIAQILLRRGFAKEDVWKMLAISWRESNWIPGVRNVGPVDDSYGLFQINMKGNLGPGRRSQYGIKDDSELLDPRINIKAARLIYGGGNLSAWNVDGDWRNGIPASKIEESKAIAKSMNLPTTGDPTMPSRGGGGTVLIEGGGVTIAPVININSTGRLDADAHRAAQEVSKLITDDIKLAVLRGM